MGKFMLFIVVCFIHQNLVLGDINEAKRNALAKVDRLMNAHRRLVNETLTALPTREANLNTISKHERETGDHLLKNTNIDVHKTAVSGHMMSTLLESPDSVSKCIDFREKEGISESNRYYKEKFLNVVESYEKEADDIQSKDVKAWISEYNFANAQFTEIYERTVVDIRNTNDEEDIQGLLDDFSRNHREMERIVLKVNTYMDRLQVQFLQILENLVVDIRNTMRTLVDRAVVGIRDCFAGTRLDKMMENIFFKSVANITKTKKLIPESRH